MFYMITDGMTQIEASFVGTTPEDVIERAREYINEYPEYRDFDNEEILEMLLNDQLEFDLVQIQKAWQGYELSKEVVRDLYENHSLPPKLYADEI
jgi:hypothetical protein